MKYIYNKRNPSSLSENSHNLLIRWSQSDGTSTSTRMWPENIIKQVSSFKYLGYELSYRNNRHVEMKLDRSHSFSGIIRHALVGKVAQRNTIKSVKDVFPLPSNDGET